MKLLILTAALWTAVVTLVVLVWGTLLLEPAALMGALAGAIHLAAVAVIRPVMNDEFKVIMTRFLIGMGMRLGGAFVWGVLAVTRTEIFPPLPTAVAYLGVLIPLLFMEIRFLK